MPTPFPPSQSGSAPHAGQSLVAPFLLGFWMDFANVQTRTCADWLAICQEAWARCASARNPLEPMAVGSLVLPACMAHVMHYCKSVSETVGAGQAALAQAGLPGAAGVPVPAVYTAAGARQEATPIPAPVPVLTTATRRAVRTLQ